MVIKGKGYENFENQIRDGSKNRISQVKFQYLRDEGKFTIKEKLIL